MSSPKTWWKTKYPRKEKNLSVSSLLLNTPKHWGGNSNAVNSTRRFFKHAFRAASITIDKFSFGDFT